MGAEHRLVSQRDRGVRTNPKDAVAALSEIRLTDRPGYGRLDSYQAFSAGTALTAVHVAANAGAIQIRHGLRMADFGAYTGGTTFALQAIAEALDGRVDALEERKERAGRIVSSGILPAEQVRNGDGIKVLKDGVQGEYGLITAFLLGPDTTGQLFRQLVMASAHALSPDGSLLVTSDSYSMQAAMRVCIEEAVPFHEIPRVVTYSEDIIVPSILVLSQADCARMQERGTQEGSKEEAPGELPRWLKAVIV